MAKRITDKQRLDHITACGVTTLVSFTGVDGGRACLRVTTASGPDVREMIDAHIREQAAAPWFATARPDGGTHA